MGGNSMRTLLSAAFVLLVATVISAAPADVHTTDDSIANGMVTQGALSQVLTFENPAMAPPPIRPKVANIKRSYAPNSDGLITKFLGGKQTLIGTGQSIVSPIW